MESIKNNFKVRWAELLPDEFLERQRKSPIVYLPMGLCEPHGHISAFGLDTIKAEYICETAARKVGGIVAPTQGYHIHETGYHAPWIEEALGGVNPRMASVPPDILLHLFLYQLRAFSNAGFKGVIAISGHSGGNQEDLRMVAKAFMKKNPMRVKVRTDPELVKGKYKGDHAGKYEISQLMHIRPDLVDMSKISRQYETGSLGRFALGHDASEASPELGNEIMDACVEETCKIADELWLEIDRNCILNHIGFQQIELIWKDLVAQRKHWATYRLHEGQVGLDESSKWKIYETPT